MRIEQQPLFVLHARAYRETSLLLECLTRDFGRIGVVARGVRRERARLHRSQLEPFQRLSMDLLLRGELGTLRAVESDGMPFRLTGDAGMSGLYLNELIVRLTARQDPQADIFDRYDATLRRLAAGEALGWTLRRFERDLLDALGYALQLEYEGDTGEALLPDGSYRYEPEHGAIIARANEPHTIRGSDLLDLARDVPPDAAGQAALRRLMRQLITFHLGGSELRAWHVLAQGGGRR
jgi:DNA repair protein RecO (recombination protein O)